MAGALGVATALAATPQVALATEQGSVTIGSSAGDAPTYRAYQIFEADITPDGHATDVEFGGSKALDGGTTQTVNGDDVFPYAVRERLIADGVLAEEERYRVGSWSAERTLEFLYDVWEAPKQSTTRILDDDDIGMSVANAWRERADTVYERPYRLLSANTAYDLDEGWWLIINDPSSPVTTAPIFTVVNHDVPVTVTEKAEVPGVPVVSKLVMEDSTGTYGSSADAHVGQAIRFKLEGTVGANYASFDSYPYVFSDHLGNSWGGMDMTAAQVEGVIVKVDGTTLDSSDYAVNLTDSEERILSVGFMDLKQLPGVTVTADSVITVEYDAHLTDSVACGTTGNENRVTVSYYANPGDDSMSQSEVASAMVYAYGMLINKVDKQSRQPLGGARFTIQAEENVTGYRWGSLVRSHETDLRILLPLIWDANVLPTDSETLSVAYRLMTNTQRMRYLAFGSNGANGWTSDAQDLFDFFKAMQTQLSPQSVDEVLSDAFAQRFYDALDASDPQQETWMSNIECFVPIIQNPQYVQSDGSLGSQAHEFETNGSGSANVWGIDEGSYIISETVAPDGYDTWDAPMRLRITRSLNAEGQLTGLTATLFGGESGGATGVTACSPESGVVEVRVGDAKKVSLPVTGLDGVTAIVIVGVAVIVISLVQIRRNSKRRNRG